MVQMLLRQNHDPPHVLALPQNDGLQLEEVDDKEVVMGFVKLKLNLNLNLDNK